MVILGGWVFLMGEVPLQGIRRSLRPMWGASDGPFLGRYLDRDITLTIPRKSSSSCLVFWGLEFGDLGTGFRSGNGVSGGCS